MRTYGTLVGSGDFFYKAVPANAGMTCIVAENWCVMGLGAVSVLFKLSRVIIGAYLRHACGFGVISSTKRCLLTQARSVVPFLAR